MTIPSKITPLGRADYLPENYTRLDFLEFTGLQYIDTRLTGVTNESYVEFRGIAKGHGKRAFQGAAYCLCSRRPDYRDFYVTVPFSNNLQKKSGYLPETKSIPYHLDAKTLSARIIVNGQSHSIDDITQDATITAINNYSLKLGAYADGSSYPSSWWVGTCERFRAQLASGEVNYIPSLTPEGQPCMFDSISKQPFPNSGSGQFIAGVNSLNRLNSILHFLPTTGGTLTLSLPAEANVPEVAERLQQCHDTKGWTLTVREYRPVVATYSMRRVREVVWCRKVQTEHGSYVDSLGTHWQPEHCTAIFGPLGQSPLAYGYEPFDSVEHAAEQWGLTLEEPLAF